MAIFSAVKVAYLNTDSRVQKANAAAAAAADAAAAYRAVYYIADNVAYIIYADYAYVDDAADVLKLRKETLEYCIEVTI